LTRALTHTPFLILLFILIIREASVGHQTGKRKKKRRILQWHPSKETGLNFIFVLAQSKFISFDHPTGVTF
jgi:hypothetical protein